MSNISNINIWPVKGHKTIKANGNVVLFGAVKVKFTVIDGQNGLFVGYPGRYGKAKDSDEDVWYPDVTLTNEEFRSDAQTTILDEYKAKTSGEVNTNTPSQTGADGITF